MQHWNGTAVLGALVLALTGVGASGEDAIPIGTRRELFVDRFLVDTISGAAELKLQLPEPQEVVLETDAPWEGNTCAYYTVFQDVARYRMYYRGAHYDEAAKKSAHPEFTCYAESADGVHWTKPRLGLFEFEGSRENNIVWAGAGSHNFTVFKDANPACRPEARYKALGGGSSGLLAFQSADGLHWQRMSEKPVITKGAFDSQNLAFWDAEAGTYREYHREFRKVRDIMTGTSPDFLHWSEPRFLEYGETELEQLYTNAILPCPRAPHILIGFPTRFQPRNQQVEPTFMASRDGLHFTRWLDAVVPITAPQDRDGNRSNYMAWGVVELPGHDGELSVYATEAYYTGPSSRLRRFTYRVDGFTSLSAAPEGGELLTKRLSFAGNKLELNCRTGVEGEVRVEIQDFEGRPLRGFDLAACTPLRGDHTAAMVSWGGGGQLEELAGQPVRLRFVLRDADVYSFRFQEGGQ